MTITEQEATAKTYLGQSFQIDNLIRNKVEQLAYLHETERRYAPLMRVEGVADSLAKSAARVRDLRQSVEDELTRLIDVKNEMSTLIQGLVPLEVRSVLEQRYLCYKPWAEIAEAMGCSERQVFHIHKKGLRLVGSLFGKAGDA